MHTTDLFHFFFRLKWPNGFRCPQCDHSQAYVIRSRSRSLPLFQCRACRHQTSLTAGTVLEGSRTPLHKWYTAIQAMARPGGINAIQLMKLIQVTYKPAWSMLRKLRQAIHDRDAKTLLSGTVNLGIAFYGKPYHHPFVRHPKETPVIVGIAYRENKTPGYLKMKPVDLCHMDGKKLLVTGEMEFLRNHVEESSRQRVASYFRTLRMPEMRFWFELVKEGINRTYRGIGRKYLEYYFDEFCWRYSPNNREEPLVEQLAGIAMRPERVWKGWQLRLVAAA